MDPIRVTHEWTEQTAHIRVEGLSGTVRVLHLTDAHLDLIDERDAEHLERFKQRTRKLLDMPARERFDRLMEQARTMGVDAVALTGDIVHFPSQANIEVVAAAMEKTGLPVLFTAGNHDWHFPSLEGRAELRQAWWPVLSPLTGGKAEFRVWKFGGIRFVAIDNSTYQVTPAQLAFAKEQLALQEPVVLLLHIPVSLPTLRVPAIEVWGNPILMGDPDWDPEGRDDWEAGADAPDTLEFVRAIAAAPRLVAILSGHLHFHHADSINLSAVQYVGKAAFEGGHRLLEFAPLH